MRDLVFVSHANPEDNEFATWLTLHLAREGYPVWLEVKRLLGGEDFWAEVEQIIRHRAVKVLFVLSHASNGKPGTTKELHLADSMKRRHSLKDFVIPLAIDDLPQAEHNINLQQLNVIPFYQNWEAGFRQLLEKLSEQQVPKDPNYNSDAVTSWWRTQHAANIGVVERPENYYSNWYPILKMPEKVYCYEGRPKRDYESDPLHLPSQELSKRFVSFATPERFGRQFDVRWQTDFKTKDVLEGVLDERYIPRTEVKKVFSHLLVDNWVRMMRQREMMIYQLSNHRFCGALREGQVKDDKVFFTGIDGKNGWRGLVGFKTLGRTEAEKRFRKWHFGLQAKAQFYPTLAYLISHHVIFSDDGQTPWPDREKQHKARRNQCRTWWNDDWRDRVLALMHWLAEGSDRVTVDCGGDSIEVSASPMVFQSPVSFVGLGGTDANDADEREAATYNVDEDDETDDDEEGGE